MEYLDPWTSRAFALADHQIAHVYVVRDPADLSRAREVLGEAGGVAELLEGEAKEAAGLGHLRAGGARRHSGAGRVVHVLLLARRRARAPTSRAPSRSTASPGTTPRSCSSIPTTAG